MKGILHSIQSMGTLDGPGMRTVVFLQGCALQCKFCHSIDTTMTDRGEEVTVEELFDRVMKYEPYWGESETDQIKGGVTISGGDPLNQPLFLLEFIKKLSERGVHVTVETSLFTDQKVLEMLLPFVDLWMVSLKHMDDAKHTDLTGKSNRTIHENLMKLDQMISEGGSRSRIRIRFVVIPGMTDDKAHIEALGSYVSRLKNLELLELLPYVSMGAYKWVELFGKYELDSIEDASTQDVEQVKAVLGQYNLGIKL